MRSGADDPDFHYRLRTGGCIGPPKSFTWPATPLLERRTHQHNAHDRCRSGKRNGKLPDLSAVSSLEKSYQICSLTSTGFATLQMSLNPSSFSRVNPPIEVGRQILDGEVFTP
jgi:hypothetical protein